MPQNNGIAPRCVSLCDTNRGQRLDLPPLKPFAAITGHLNPHRTVGMAPVPACSQEWGCTISAPWSRLFVTVTCWCSSLGVWHCQSSASVSHVHPVSAHSFLPLCVPSLFVPPSLGLQVLQLLQWEALPAGCTEQRTVLT